jgi:subtilisin family serine protease
VWAELESEGLAAPGIAREARGRGVTVAIVDSGVNFEHPHLAGAGSGRGCAIEWSQGDLEIREGVFRDLYGHGTCCAALIHALAPESDLLAIRVTGDRATTDADRLAEGIRAAAARGASVIAVPMGTETVLRAALDEAVAAVSAAGAVVAAAWPHRGVLPAECPGALAVGARDGVDVIASDGRVYAEGVARPAPGGRRNFFGPSLATARAAAALARWAETSSLRGIELLGGFKNALPMR